MIERLAETIVAIASPPGTGAAGIVRLSGSRAIELASELLDRPDDLKDQPSWTRAERVIAVEPGLHLPATINLFRAPGSYTRDDLVEIITVGAPVVLDLLRRRLIDLGALPAEPGEFTARAFLSGGMALSQAEAVAGVIEARTDTQLRAARRLMDGALAQPINEARDALAELLALVEADIDFAEEPIEFITPKELQARITDVSDRLARLVATSAYERTVQTVPQVLLFGAPNAGKSTLINRLSGTDRAICAAIAGTTRDLLRAPARLGEVEVMLIDAAGIDDSEDEIIATARGMVMAEASCVDVLCVVLDASSEMPTQLAAAARELAVAETVVVINKIDAVSAERVASFRQSAEQHFARLPVCVSALTGDGMGALTNSLVQACGARGTTAGAQELLLNDRHRRSIAQADAALARAGELCAEVSETIDCAELLAFELREATDALGTITGAVTTDDLLGQVFARFCIGK